MTKSEQIVQVFNQRGGALTLRELAAACIEESVFTTEELESARLKWAQGQCRDALKQINPFTGLPYAGPTPSESGKPPQWKQMALWDYDAFEYNIHLHVNQLESDHRALRRLWDWGIERWGKAPDIPKLLTEVGAHR